MNLDWMKEFDASVTICGDDGTILYMNDRSVKTFESDGGINLIGKSLFDCHPEPSKTRLKDLFENKESNCYTIEKNGIKKLIFQSPWYNNEKFMGIVEISLVLPDNLQHFIRD